MDGRRAEGRERGSLQSVCRRLMPKHKFTPRAKSPIVCSEDLSGEIVQSRRFASKEQSLFSNLLPARESKPPPVPMKVGNRPDHDDTMPAFTSPSIELLYQGMSHDSPL